MQVKEAQETLQEAANRFAAGDARTALLLSRQILQAGHNGVGVWEVHAQAALGVGDLSSAINSMEKAIQKGGATVDRALFYGDLLLRAKQWQAAANIFQQIVKQQDDSTTAWLGLGHCLLGSVDVARAAQAYSAVIERDENHQDGLLKLAVCELYLGDSLKALALLERLKKQGELSMEATYYYGEALRRASYVEESIALFEAHLADAEWGEKMQKSLINAWLSLEQFSLAQDALTPMLKAAPDDSELLSFQARLYFIEDKSEDAAALVEKVLDQQPDNVAMWELYASLLKEPMPSARFALLSETMEVMRKNKQERSLAGLHFTAAGHYNLSGDYQQEVAELDKANALVANLDPYDNKRHADNVARTRHSYRRDTIANISAPRDGFFPVYVLCPPRSGSTLLEQALGRHPFFQAAGEKNFLSQAWYQVSGSRVTTLQPEIHEELTAEQVRQFATAYKQAVKGAHLDDQGGMIHKGINNHKAAGLLKAAFPEARFIDLRRDPMDVAFGCYRQNFDSQAFSFTPEGCASEIRLFQDNMAWWHEQFGESIMTMGYADLVDDFEGELRKLLAWLGLEWDDACLDFKRQSQVGTASAGQVRQGLFKQGVGRWRKYEKHLSPLIDALKRQGLDPLGE